MIATLTHREVAMLRAVAAGRAEVTLSAEPDLYVDGVPCCDQPAAHRLAHNGFIAPTRPGLVQRRVPAVLTGRARDLLADQPIAA